MTDLTLTFGKYNGKKLSQVPLSYVQWLSEQPTICGKMTIPQAAKAFLGGYPSPFPNANAGHSKFCMSCRQEIVGEAIPVEERMSTGGRTTSVKTRYLCVVCANQMEE